MATEPDVVPVPQQMTNARFETEDLAYMIESADGLAASDWIEEPDSWSETKSLTDHGDGTVTVRIKRLVLEEDIRTFVRLRISQMVP